VIPRNPFILDQKVKGPSHEAQKSVPAWVCTLVSAGFSL